MEKGSSIFSNYLRELGYVNEQDGFLKCIDIYDRLRIAYNQGVTGLLYQKRIFLPRDDEDWDYFEECFYEIFEHEDCLKNLIRWVNKKITLQLGLAEYKTIGVRIRIATGMINKLVDEGSISKNLGMRLHYHLVRNVSSENCLFNSEELPF